MLIENYLLISKLLFILIGIFGVLIAFWVYFANRQKKENRYFFLMTFFIVVWISFGYFANIETEYNSALIWTKIAAASALLFLMAAFFFIIYFIEKEKIPKIIDKIILPLGIIFAVITLFTDLFFEGVYATHWGFLPKPGRIWNIYNGFAFLMGSLIFFIALKKYLKLSEKEKLKMQYFLVGFLIFIFMNILFNIVFPIYYHTYQLYQFGNYSAIFLLGFTAYAIVKRELFGIKVVLTSLLVGLIAILLLLDALVLTENLTFQLLKGVILIIFLYFGYLLITSVLGEIKRREEIEKLSKAKSEFISIASHQLRTPLTAIKGYISMILEGTYGKLSQKSKKPMENVYKSSERLIKMVNDLLSVSRIEAGKIEISFEKLSLEEIITSILEELKNEAKKKNIYLKWEKPKRALPKISADRDKIRQVVFNVVDNAIRYTKEGTITISLNSQNSNLKISVKDTGEGLTKYELSKMFESFSRGVAGTRLYTEGVGLGLYIARKFVEMHNGKIWAESEGRGKGSTFYIELSIK